MPGTRRLFFAIWPDAAARDALHRVAMRIADDGGGRAMNPDTLHMTLAFLGDVAEDRVPAVVAIGERVAADCRSVDLALDRIGRWRHNRIDWAGCEAIPDHLAGLAHALGEALSEAGFPVDARPWSPHVTLVRKRGRDTLPAGVELPAWRVAEMLLVESTCDAAGARYRAVARWPLI